MSERSTVALPGVCDLNAASPLRERLLAALDAGGDVAIDASAVVSLGTPCAQVLLAADRAAMAREPAVRLRVAGGTAAFNDALRDLGLDTALSRWSDA